MNSQDQGLTVGELTITIAIVIIAGLIWTNISRNQESDQSKFIQSSPTILLSSMRN
ncbi:MULTISPECIES: hypothetical protein [Prochlorococcus]|uniref:hypothetical protein n=1 Tax=Prochlorococcus TaxID=1218 RepID=UPI0002E52FBA|nr:MULTISPECIES: hypothetical protein [Prochlorococcus]KGG11266.1 hypothetical protein EV04_1342 [Prochlorococcus marinus str. LG]KGG21605.1 hypothetical protein EV08_0694 [Prochlorococcus marinus str. SS2]KGG23053.1 hypothetical protein EV09_1798 [Prochlorococcus marinus str. SS35]KGG33760.1 hypothetical protein EV10_0197 [Prochlorococcus marinus str. SS51]KGG36889.1 hypothetical protein EV11_0673 [Prochlorococcus sp. SS52]